MVQNGRYIGQVIIVCVNHTLPDRFETWGAKDKGFDRLFLNRGNPDKAIQVLCINPSALIHINEFPYLSELLPQSFEILVREIFLVPAQNRD